MLTMWQIGADEAVWRFRNKVRWRDDAFENKDRSSNDFNFEQSELDDIDLDNPYFQEIGTHKQQNLCYFKERVLNHEKKIYQLSVDSRPQRWNSCGYA